MEAIAEAEARFQDALQGRAEAAISDLYAIGRAEDIFQEKLTFISEAADLEDREEYAASNLLAVVEAEARFQEDLSAREEALVEEMIAKALIYMLLMNAKNVIKKSRTNSRRYMCYIQKIKKEKVLIAMQL